MGNGIAAIDHMLIGVRDLEAARESWRRLGFTPTPRGRHIGRGTANYCIMFAQDYLELIGRGSDPESRAAPADERSRQLDAFLARREGAMAAAFAPEGGAEAAHAALAGRGLHPGEPRALARRIELPEGDATPRFSLVSLPPEETPGLDCFLCGHLTPELMRRPEWLAHANGALGINGFHVLVETTAPLITAYDRLFGLSQVTTTDAVLCLQIGRQRIMFSTPDDFLTMHPALDLAADFPLPGIAAIEFAAADLDETAAFLRRAGIALAQLPGGSLAVPASEASGAILFFSAG